MSAPASRMGPVCVAAEGNGVSKARWGGLSTSSWSRAVAAGRNVCFFPKPGMRACNLVGNFSLD